MSPTTAYCSRAVKSLFTEALFARRSPVPRSLIQHLPRRTGIATTPSRECLPPVRLSAPGKAPPLARTAFPGAGICPIGESLVYRLGPGVGGVGVGPGAGGFGVSCPPPGGGTGVGFFCRTGVTSSHKELAIESTPHLQQPMCHWREGGVVWASCKEKNGLSKRGSLPGSANPAGHRNPEAHVKSRKPDDPFVPEGLPATAMRRVGQLQAAWRDGSDQASKKSVKTSQWNASSWAYRLDPAMFAGEYGRRRSR